jgi:hypothetical protein
MIRQAHRLQIEGDVGRRHPRGRNYQDTDEDGQAQENAAGFGGWLGCVTIDGLCDRAVQHAAERQRQQCDEDTPDYQSALSCAIRKR